MLTAVVAMERVTGLPQTKRSVRAMAVSGTRYSILGFATRLHADHNYSQVDACGRSIKPHLTLCQPTRINKIPLINDGSKGDQASAADGVGGAHFYQLFSPFRAFYVEGDPWPRFVKWLYIISR